MRLTAFWRLPLFPLCLSRQSRPGACTKSWKKVTGRHIDLKTKVEPAVLGGIRLDIEGTELDGTVRSRLAGLRSSIAAATL
ncbi:F0F1 ATP synthase subunit delta [Faecalibacterium prausnitzii]|uniref:F0F1 ATP synthase subunit delta n=1 Tax=Faecalibacterium prausnitzii TaxID=853 RepID=UPI003EBC1D7D